MPKQDHAWDDDWQKNMTSNAKAMCSNLPQAPLGPKRGFELVAEKHQTLHYLHVFHMVVVRCQDFLKTHNFVAQKIIGEHNNMYIYIYI